MNKITIIFLANIEVESYKCKISLIYHYLALTIHKSDS